MTVATSDPPAAAGVGRMGSALRAGQIEGPREETSLLAFLGILLYSRRLVAACALGGMVIFGALAASEANLYLSRASYVVKGSRNTAELPGGAAALGIALAASGEFAQSVVFYSDLVKARTILTPVARKTYRTTSAGAERFTLARVYGIEETNPNLATALAVERLIGDVSSSIYSRSGVVGIAVRSTDPLVAQQLATNILVELDGYAAERRRELAIQERKFIEGLVGEARQRLARAEEAVSTFSRVNREYENAPQLRLEFDRLTRDVMMQQQIYTALTQSYEQARIEEVRDPTAINIVEPPDLPAAPERRAALRKTLLGLAAGFFLGVVLAFVRWRARESRQARTAGFMELSAAAELSGLAGWPRRQGGTEEPKSFGKGKT